MTRLMLTRPETHDTLAGLDRFRCHDIPAVLTRANCARRYTLAATLRRTRGGTGEWTSDVAQARPLGVCRGCPVGAVHAREAGNAARGGKLRIARPKRAGAER